VLERIWNHIIAFVVIVLLIASTPLLTFAAAEGDPKHLRRAFGALR